MKLLFGSGAAILALAAITMPGIAQSTIQDLRSANTVMLSGEVVRVMGDDFILDDGTGQIMVDAESAAVREAALSPGASVTVMGRYDDEDFDAVTLMLPNGQEIYVFDD